MNSFIVDSAGKPVNPLLGTLDENFEWDASKKLHWPNRRWSLAALLACRRLRSSRYLLVYHQDSLTVVISGI
jgi:hypothetical protein